MSSSPHQSKRLASDSGARIVTGDVIDGRYRIVARLGKGGMGEVWRAEDVELGQEVALKFLPEELARDADARRQFLDEVRLARLVSHPNVCRVHDVGGGETGTYITMEYVHGEDLSSLLRRVGRLPEDRAIDIARELCAGLAAAHAEGLIHRDLKPANVLIDGRGRPRIADFGLSALAADVGAGEARVGTPRYMAPEQLRGEGVSVKSDLFSLGLVLFELFTGKGAFQATTLDELMHAHETLQPNARAHVAALDPAIDALLRRCLARDPARRPASALEVAAALPGGDPLAAALAAGETPSPALVAASGGAAGLRPRTAVGLVAIVAALLFASAWADEQRKLIALVAPELSEPVLRQRALDTARSVGLYESAERPEDSHGYVVQRVRRELAQPGDDPWRTLRHPWSESVRFWWRGSDRPLDPIESSGIVGWEDPPPSREGDVRLILGHDGRLLAFDATPRKADVERAAQATPAASPYDWSAALAAAGLAGASLTPVPATFLARTDNDTKVTWTGPAPGLDGATVRVSGASLGGRPVHFAVQVDWGRPPFEASRVATGLRRAFELSTQLLGALALFGGLWLGARNLRAGNGDVRGSRRLALGFLLTKALVWALAAHHAAGFQRGFFYALPFWLFESLFIGALYLALEPTVRREWPQRLVTWQRFLGGHGQDPAVARDVLVGLVGGLAIHALMLANWLAVAALGDTSAAPVVSTSASLGALREQLSDLAAAPIGGVEMALFTPFLYALALKATRRHALASLLLGFVALVRMPYAVFSETPWLDLGFRAVQVVVLLALLHRAGLVALFSAFTLLHALPNVTATLSFEPWYASAWQLLLVCLGVVTAWSCWTASRSHGEVGRGRPA